MASESSTLEEPKLSFESLVSMTNEAKKSKNDSYAEKLNIAYEEAKNEIVKGSFEKMKNDASKGYDKSILYSFGWVEDPKAIIDENGNRIVFRGNIRILDMLYKGRPEFMKLLNEHFNKGYDSPRFHCGFFKRTNDETKLDNWFIFVSWAPYREQSDDSRDTNDRKPNRHQKYDKKKQTPRESI
jgi:hypothetical protein